MKLHLNITGKLTLILVFFGTVLLGGLGALAYTSGRAGLKEAATSELLTRAIEKQAALDNWITAARTNIAAQAVSPIIAEQAAALLSAAPGSPEALAAHDRLVTEFQPHVGSSVGFTELFFIEAETGQVFAATDPSEEGKFKENLSFFINGKSAPYVSEMYFSVALGRPAMTAAAPVISDDGRLLGVLAGRLDLDILNTLINRRTGLHQTDDAFLTNSIGLLVTQPRFISDPGILQIALKTEAVRRCLGGNSGVISADDYRGVPALISYRWLPERQMCLIVKIDHAEAFAPSLAFSRTVALTGGLALVFSIAAAIMLARRFTRPILDLQNGVNRLGQGDLEYRVAVKSSDEVGLLGAAFNEMIVSLEKQVAERKQAEQALRRSHDLLNLTGQIARVGGWELDLETQTLNWSEEVYRIHEVDPATRLNVAEAINFYAPEAQPVVSAAVQAAIDSGASWDLELPLITAHGRRIWARAQGAAEQRNGKTVRIFGAFQDITERKQAERVRDALYSISQAVVTTASLPDIYPSIHRALGNLMPADNFYIALYDPDADLISFPYLVDQYDEPSPPKKPGRGLTEYVLRTGRPLLADPQTFAQLIQQGEVELVGADSVDWLGVPLKAGTKVFGVIVVQSYTEGVRFGTAEKEMLEFISTQVASAIERKLIQQRIADALEFNNTLIDASTLGISAYDASGQCILANEAIARIVGATREQVLEQNYDHVASWKKTGLLDTAREAVSSGKNTRREIHTTSSFGKEIWLDCRFTPFVSNGEPHLLLTIDDISIPKQAEVALQTYAAKLEQSNRDLQEFAYVASHDLQEPLRKVQAFSDRLATKYADVLDDTGRDYLKRMRNASQRMQILINDLLGFSRVSTRAQPFTKVDLNTIAREALSDLENRIEHTHARVEIGELPVIEADPTQMHQLLQNLVGNALKFHHEERSPLIKISAKTEGDACHISVEDNGIGFDTQYLDRIFKPFQRLHNREEYEGSGMGLAICRRIAERHAGSITATSAPGKGTTFLVTLPIHPSKGEQ
jgi:PAS domain S-box-containing protein